MEYPHWLMIAGAVLVAFGFVGFAFSQNKNESREHLNARNETARSAEEVANLAEQESRQGTPTERLKAMREYASAAGGLKAKGK
jgi:Flp pilus assembly protein TadB